jgi:hypothetical protein
VIAASDCEVALNRKPMAAAARCTSCANQQGQARARWDRWLRARPQTRDLARLAFLECECETVGAVVATYSEDISEC